MIRNLLLVGIGGFTGSVLRYVTYLLIDKKFTSNFLVSTMTVNVIGSLILGIIIGFSLKGNLNEQTKLLLAVGFCGSFTTFSTFAFENFNLLQQRETLTSLLYIGMSVILGLIAVYVGLLIAKSIG
ncbi:MAG TPA: fluoride efflux transporter CrcB [Fulvivirga sp.]|nr:fluoride efflux transporter CrcB [Fulvivirga sp.]